MGKEVEGDKQLREGGQRREGEERERTEMERWKNKSGGRRRWEEGGSTHLSLRVLCFATRYFNFPLFHVDENNINNTKHKSNPKNSHIALINDLCLMWLEKATKKDLRNYEYANIFQLKSFTTLGLSLCEASSFSGAHCDVTKNVSDWHVLSWWTNTISISNLTHICHTQALTVKSIKKLN